MYLRILHIVSLKRCLFKTKMLELVSNIKSKICESDNSNETIETTKFVKPAFTFVYNARDKNPLCMVRIVGGYYFLIKADVLMFVHLFLFSKRQNDTIRFASNIFSFTCSLLPNLIILKDGNIFFFVSRQIIKMFFYNI